ncbi:LysR family transcriptional regulator [Clostridium sp.]|uniref:LysR family transcriptional regulator n=1 Tax=Clostridium sp. TaxID=1506 RepID=UPI002FCB8EF2
MDLNLQKYIAFVKTVEYGSFTKAAEILNYSQSGISRMINDLEKEWNLVLLIRNKTGVKLTSAGTKLLPHAKRVVEEYENLQMEAAELNGLQSGIIRIGTFSSIATHWLPKIIKEFQKDYPNIEYELLLGDYNEIEDWIVTGRVDCGFLRLPTNHSFDTIFLDEDKLLAVLPENHPLTKYEKVPVTELCNDPFMLLQKGSNLEISKIFETYGLKPQVHFTTWDDYAIMSMVESGLGIGILPELILKRTPYNIVSRELDIDAYRQIVFAMQNEKTSSLAVKRFINYLNYR